MTEKQENKRMTDEQINKIREIAIKYKISLTGKVPPQDINIKKSHEKRNTPLDTLYICRFNTFLEPSITEFLEGKGIYIDSSPKLKLARLIELLARSLTEKQTEITITTKTGHSKHSVSITDKETVAHLWHFSNIILDYLQDGMYEYMPKYEGVHEEEYERLFDWYKDKKTYSSKFPRMYQGNIMPFTDSELEEIINYEEKSLEKSKNNPKNQRSNYLSRLIDFYKKNGIFDDSIKTIRTNEACFLYDSLAELKVILKDASFNEQDKYQYIKRYMKK